MRPALALALLLALARPARADEAVLDAGAAPAPSAFAWHPAATLDPAPFSRAQRVRAQPSADGVSRVPLSPAVLSVARDDLADLRVIDAEARQWPFVLVPDAGHATLDLRIEAARVESGRSRRRLVPPVSPAVLDGLALRVDRDLFDRAFRLVGELPGDRTTTLATGRLVRGVGGSAEIAVKMPRARVAALALIIDDGDEAPLPLGAARAEAPVAELWLVAPAGQYTLLAGDAETRPPRYEIARARESVLAARAGEADVGALAPNPQYRPRPSGGGEKERDQLVLWSVIALAVVALGALTLRLSRREQPPAPPGDEKGPPPPAGG